MSYEKTVWTAGDVITAEKLNNIENGIEAAGSALSRTYPVYLITNGSTTAQPDLSGNIGHDILIPFANVAYLGAPAYELFMGNSSTTWESIIENMDIPFFKKTLGNDKGFIIIMPNLDGYDDPTYDRIFIYDPTTRDT